MVSADGGTNYNVPVATLSGAVGAGVSIGNDKRITWNAGADWPGRFSSACRVRIIADDGSSPPAPSGMVYVPAGAFQMGDSFYEQVNALPLHNVFVSAFFMDKFEVSREVWLDVYAWAIGHGYGFSTFSFTGPNHPVYSIYWWDAVKWCNARSEKENLTPVYYNDDAHTSVYRSGGGDFLTNRLVKWTANGYRLPTEAEWEKAARGGSQGKRYPWGDSITFNSGLANYGGSGDPYENSNPGTTPVGYYDGSQIPAGLDMANGYGLYDMAGNVAEWCWDRYDEHFYSTDASTQNDPHGPETGTDRLTRGGSWVHTVTGLQCSWRSPLGSTAALNYAGFRCVKSF